jgi:hypothetical protein
MIYTPDALAALDLKNGWPQSAVPEFVSIQIAESGGDPKSIGYDNAGATVQDTQGADASVPFSSYDTGLAQVNSVHNPNNGPAVYDLNWVQKMQDPNQNTKEALALSGGGTNFSPWSGDNAVRSGNFAVGNQALQDVLSGKTSAVGGTPVGSTASAAGTSSSSAIAGSSTGNTQYANLTGIAGVLQAIDGLLNPGGPSGGLNGIFGLLTGATEADIAKSIEALAIRLFFAAGFAAIAFIGIKTITTGNGKGGGVTIIEGAERRARISNAQTNAATAQQDSARKAAAAQLQYDSAAAQRQHEATQARLTRADQTRRENRARRMANQ